MATTSATSTGMSPHATTVPLSKVYEEERELTVMLLVDVSGSRNFGAVGEEKRQIIAEISATLAFSATQNNDKIRSHLLL